MWLRDDSMSDKSIALETVRKMSEEATHDEIAESLAIAAALKRGEEAADAGRVIPHDEIRRMVTCQAALPHGWLA